MSAEPAVKFATEVPPRPVTAVDTADRPLLLVGVDSSATVEQYHAVRNGLSERLAGYEVVLIAGGTFAVVVDRGAT